MTYNVNETSGQPDPEEEADKSVEQPEPSEDLGAPAEGPEPAQKMVQGGPTTFPDLSLRVSVPEWSLLYLLDMLDPTEGEEPLEDRDIAEFARQEQALRELGREFTQKASKLDELLNKAEENPREAADHYREASVLACRSLREILEYEPFREGVRLLAKKRSEPRDPLVWDPMLRITWFLERVKELLKELNCSDPSRNRIVNDCKRLLEKAGKGQAPRGRLFVAIGRVRDQTCDVADDLKAKALLEEKRKRTADVLRVAGKVIAGVGLTLISASMLASGADPVFAAGLGMCGGGLIQAAAQEL